MSSNRPLCYLSLDASGDVKQWHVSSGQCLWAMKEDRQVLTCSISSDASRLLTSGSDAKIHLYDATTRQHLSTFESRYDLSLHIFSTRKEMNLNALHIYRNCQAHCSEGNQLFSI